ncbi:MAG: RHS repeat-associated core domain-containing protein [Chloroflexi bacterium]|nr:RHS repeat-associated core domain-containing protein [Chloroflexota bacterium]
MEVAVDEAAIELVVSYGYGDASRRTSITYPGGSNQATYGYDNANRLTSVTDWDSNATTYAYDDAGCMTTATLPSGTGVVSTYTYDNADRLTAISHDKGGTTLASETYTLDNAGNRTQKVDLAGTESYSYDNAYRLTSVTYPGPSTTSYTYDAFGNRSTKVDAGGTTTYAYDDDSRLTSVTPPSPTSAIIYTWDNNGDLTARGSDSFAWDYEDRMVSATVNSVTTTFAYRGDGLRNSRTTGGNTTTFTWDIASGLPVVLDDGSQYVYGAGLVSQQQGGSWYYCLADGLGSTIKTVDSTGAVVNAYTYDVYGKTATSSGTQANDFQFAGQQTDGTGLQYLRARYYDPETGGFLSRDPLATAAGWPGSPLGYSGNPASFVDPSGLDECSWRDPWECTKDAGHAIWGGASSAASATTDQLRSAVDALADFAVGKATDPLVQLSIAQAAAGFAAVLACAAVPATFGGAAPACAAAVALVGYTIWAKEAIIRRRYLEGEYNEAEFACQLITSAPFPVPGVLPGVSIPLCPALGKLQDIIQGDSDDADTPNGEK